MTRKAPVFLERRGYRLRRVMDAARILPLVGLGLWLLPLLWGDASTRGGIVFIFTVWLILVLTSAVISYRLRDATRGDDQPASLRGGRG